MKQAKIAIIVIGLLVGGFFVVQAITSGGPALDGRLELVDISTGEITRADRASIPGFPALNADGKALLVPIERRDDQIYIRSGLENLVREIVTAQSLSPDAIAVDLNTFAVRDR
jgi:hypothetical protein